MRTIPGVALGTYYAPGATAAERSTHVSQMRGLVYLVKDNRPKGSVGAQVVGHPRLPERKSERLDQATVVGYCAQIVADNFETIRAVLALGAEEIAIIPIPSSKVTAANAQTAKWRTLALARELEALGVGVTVPALVNRAEHASKSEGARHDAGALVKMMQLVARVPTGKSVLLIDDLIDDGNHLTAADVLLGHPERVGICVVGLIDSQPVANCLLPRGYTLSYEETSTPLRPYVEKRAPPKA